MYTDMMGVKRLKVNLHQHTTCSDGRKTPQEAADIYRRAGYDLIAITDHWVYRESGEINGLRTLGGAEFNIGGADGAKGVYHLLALGCSRIPTPSPDQPAQQIIDHINACGGMAVLAHPAWSLNTVQQAEALRGVGATEIYNTVSDVHESSRPYSGDFVDTCACRGIYYPLLATDDTHRYDGMDETKSWIMLACAPDASDQEILQAIRDRRFYATQGPEIHLEVQDGEVVVRTSPVSRIAIFTNSVWTKGHGHRGDGLTEARCALQPFETFVRAEATDAQGRKAWSNVIAVK